MEICQSHARLMIAGAWLSSLMLLMIDRPIKCWEVKKVIFDNILQAAFWHERVLISFSVIKFWA